MARWICWVSRPGVTAVLLLLTVVLLALGIPFPQRPDDPAAAARWKEAVYARYDALAPTLEHLGLFRWYRTPVPWVALALLAAVTLLCTLNRWPALRPSLARRSAPHWGTLLTHLAVPLLLAALAAGAMGWREEHTLAIGETVALACCPGLSLRADDVRVVRYPDGTPADYAVELAVLRVGREVVRGTARVNAPMSVGGVRFLLTGYALQDGRPRITLLAVSDPGTPFWIVGGGMMLAGLALTLLYGGKR